MEALLAAATPSSPLVRVLPVESRRALARFIEVPQAIYAADPMWVPPLMVERRRHLRRSPFLSHACARLWVAERQGRPVGRISAQIDELYLERYSDKSGYFGFIEAPDDAETFAALFQTAEDWLRERGMRRAIGPFSFSINDECGLLIDGFDTPPMFMMGHARPYYDSRIQEQGYRKATDTVAYIIDPRATPPPVMSASVERLQASRVRIRPFRLKHMREDLAILRDVFNDAWANNWGFVPFTTSELDDLGGSLKLFIPPELIQIAEVDGRAVGIIVAVPNLNEILSDLGGRLLPLGWLRLLWRLKRHAVKSGRVPIMGVRREMQRSALGMALVFALIEAVREPVCRYGFERVELSWTLEGNRPMHHIKQRLGARAYKTYRLYEKALA